VCVYIYIYIYISNGRVCASGGVCACRRTKSNIYTGPGVMGVHKKDLKTSFIWG